MSFAFVPPRLSALILVVHQSEECHGTPSFLFKSLPSMKIKITLLVVLFSFVAVGCAAEKPVDDSKPAPAPQFKMIPSQKSGQ